MERGGARFLLFLVLDSAVISRARAATRWGPEDWDYSLNAIQVNQALSHQRISPTLEPESSKKFFGKDYPRDKRPEVDVLHFKHPYPVVQDSGDFDRDFVKDENSDNGHWMAQQEYDRLRHKLAKEKEDAAKALAKKRAEEKELKETMEDYARRKRDSEAAIAKKKKQEEKPKEEAVKKDTLNDAKESEEGAGWSWSWSWKWWPWNWGSPEKKQEAAPEPVKEVRGVKSATEATENAMGNLEECQKELAKAREDLKRLMDKLEEAKQKQKETIASQELAEQKQAQADHSAESLHSKVESEEKEYMAAKEAYLKQKEIYDKLKADLDAAASKVKAQRDAADADGGVYPTPTRSMALSVRSPNLFSCALAAFLFWQCDR